MNVDLVAFLRRMLDADEQAARDASAGPWWAEDTSPRRWGEERDAEVASSQGRVALLDHDRNGDLNAEHVARWDPARVLAEVEAKRKIMAEAFHHAATIDSEWGCCHDAEEIEQGMCPDQRPDELALLRLLARPYVGHPGYRPEWASGA